MTRNAFWGLCISLCLAGTQAVAQPATSSRATINNKKIPFINEVGAQAMPENIAPMGHTPFAMPQPEKPVFPDFIVNMKDKGISAEKPITSAVNQTIAEVSAKGGGTVVIPKGKWKSARLVLKSNVNLHLEEGAEIEFCGTAEDYLPAVFTRHEGMEIMGPGAFIYANGEKNIAVTGKGTIYGPPMDAEIRKRPNGASVVEKDIPWDMPIEQRIYDGMEGRTFYRPKTISPINCTNVLIEGVTIERSVLWNVVPIYCENVIIRGVTVNSTKVPSGDGIDIESCKDVLIEYCTLNCGDDCFTLKAGRAEDGLRVGKPTENVVIRYSLAQHGHGGVTCGSETAGVIKNLYVHDCVFDGTRTGIRFKTRRNRGGGSENTYYERLRMINVGKAFTWDLLGSAMYMGELAERYPARKVNKLTPDVKNIRIKDFIVESADQFFTANGIPEIPFNKVVVENGTIKCKKLIGALNDVKDFTLRNLEIETSEGNEIHILDGQDILFDEVKFTVPGKEVKVCVEGDRSKNILFKDSKGKEVKYKGVSPFTVIP
ncbi:glycoside hydrolase family 28 protein [Phocaeicola sp.]